MTEEKQYNCALCGSRHTTDLTHGRCEHGPNIACSECGGHTWRGKNYTKEEWDAYVNDMDNKGEKT